MPEDLTGTVAFLTGDDAAFVTGQTIMADGGYARCGPPGGPQHPTAKGGGGGGGPPPPPRGGGPGGP
ncbi:hypothetical protein ACFV3E_29520, partial [Streptomyces sp. NPDC059718]